MLTRMARMLTHMLTRMTRWLAYYTHSVIIKVLNIGFTWLKKKTFRFTW